QERGDAESQEDLVHLDGEGVRRRAVGGAPVAPYPPKITIALPQRLDQGTLLLVRKTLHPRRQTLVFSAVAELLTQELPEGQGMRDDFRAVLPATDLSGETKAAQNGAQALDIRRLFFVEVEELLVRLAATAGHRPLGEVVARQREEIVVDRDLTQPTGRNGRAV